MAGRKSAGQLNCSSFTPKLRLGVGAAGGATHATAMFVTLAPAMLPLPFVTEHPCPEG